MKTSLKIISFFLSIMTVVCCSSKKYMMHVKRTTVQKMVFNETEMDTKISIYLDESPLENTYTSLVFNRQEVPVTVDTTDNLIRVTGIIQNIKQRNEAFNQKEVDKSNRLNYTHHGEKAFYQLDNIDFLPTKITPN